MTKKCHHFLEGVSNIFEGDASDSEGGVICELVGYVNTYVTTFMHLHWGKWHNCPILLWRNFLLLLNSHKNFDRKLWVQSQFIANANHPICKLQ